MVSDTDEGDALAVVLGITAVGIALFKFSNFGLPLAIIACCATVLVTVLCTLGSCSPIFVLVTFCTIY